MKVIRVGNQIVSLENVLEVCNDNFNCVRIRYRDNPSIEGSVVISTCGINSREELIEKIYKILAEEA